MDDPTLIGRISGFITQAIMANRHADQLDADRKRSAIYDAIDGLLRAALQDLLPDVHVALPEFDPKQNK